MHEPGALLTRDPTLSGHAGAAVEGDCELVRHERAALRHPGAPPLVLGPRFERVDEPRLHPGRTEPLEAAGRLGVRVERAGDDPHDPCFECAFGAGRCRSPVRARLHRHVARAPPGAPPAAAHPTPPPIPPPTPLPPLPTP